MLLPPYTTILPTAVEQVHSFSDRNPPNRIEYSIKLFFPSCFFQHLFKICVSVINRKIYPLSLKIIQFMGTGSSCNHAASSLCHLNQGRSHPTCCCMDQYMIAGMEVQTFFQCVPSRTILNRQGQGPCLQVLYPLLELPPVPVSIYDWHSLQTC
jgi:hypothetical protein